MFRIYMKMDIYNFSRFLSFCIFRDAAFADDIDFDLSGIFKLCFDLVRNISCDDDHLLVSDLLRLYHDPDFTSCLNGIGFFYTREAVGDFL